MIDSDDYDEWDVSVDDRGVATLRLLHEKSAINKRGMTEFRDLFSHLPHLDEVRAILVTGGSGPFCVGLEMQTFVDILDATPDDDAERQRRIRDLVHRFHGAVLEMRNAPCPIVAAVDGVAAGGGFSLALASDYVLASPQATFTHAYTNIGATADGGSTYYLPRLVGIQKAKELVFTPQPVSAAEMADLGLVNDVVDERFESAVRERTQELVDRPTEAIARSKRLLNESLDSTLEQQLQREHDHMAEVVLTEEFEARVRAFVDE